MRRSDGNNSAFLENQIKSFQQHLSILVGTHETTQQTLLTLLARVYAHIVDSPDARQFPRFHNSEREFTARCQNKRKSLRRLRMRRGCCARKVLRKGRQIYAFMLALAWFYVPVYKPKSIPYDKALPSNSNNVHGSINREIIYVHRNTRESINSLEHNLATRYFHSLKYTKCTKLNTYKMIRYKVLIVSINYYVKINDLIYIKYIIINYIFNI